MPGEELRFTVLAIWCMMHGQLRQCSMKAAAEICNTRTWLCSNKTLFTKTSSGPDLIHKPYFVDPCSMGLLGLPPCLQFLSVSASLTHRCQGPHSLVRAPYSHILQSDNVQKQLHVLHGYLSSSTIIWSVPIEYMSSAGRPCHSFYFVQHFNDMGVLIIPI